MRGELSPYFGQVHSAYAMVIHIRVNQIDVLLSAIHFIRLRLGLISTPAAESEQPEQHRRVLATVDELSQASKSKVCPFRGGMWKVRSQT